MRDQGYEGTTNLVLAQSGEGTARLLERLRSGEISSLELPCLNQNQETSKTKSNRSILIGK